MTLKKVMASAAAVVGLAFGGIAVVAQPAVAATCTYQTVGAAGHLIVGSTTVATITQVYCSANRTAYAHLAVNTTWASGRTFDVLMSVRQDCCDVSYSNTWWDTSMTSFQGAAMPIDGHSDKAFYVLLDFKYNNCISGTKFGDSNYRYVRTNEHDYSNGSNSGGGTDVTFASC